MAESQLHILRRPTLTHGRMVLAFTGWMDGGDVSTGTVKRLVEQLDAQEIARIEPRDFYIYNFPGAMEVSALFRPHVNYEDGLIKEFEMPANRFLCAEAENLAFFLGKEPNLNWEDFARCVFDLAKAAGVTRLLFVGSFGGSVPHTREPRLFGSVSHPDLLPVLEQYGLGRTSYEGPASFATYVMSRAPAEGLEMISLVAEIPGYVQGVNPPSIVAISKRLGAILGVPVSLDEMREASDEWETRVSAAVADDDDLAKQIRELEERYDDELIGDSDEA